MTRRILVVDDDPLSLDLFQRILRSDDTEVVEAASAGEALAVLANAHRPFDLIVTDMSMPAMSGMQFLRFARRSGVKIPFLVVSALTSPVLDLWVREFDQTAVLAKPVSTEQLREAVTMMIADFRQKLGSESW